MLQFGVRPHSLRLEAGARLSKEHKLFLCGLAAQNLVAMRIAPEAVDYGLVPELEVVVALRSAFLEQTLRDSVDQPGLTVHVRHVYKDALVFRELEVISCCDGLLSQRQSEGIRCESQLVASEHVPGELVQDYDFSQSATGILAPQEQLRLGCTSMQIGEPVQYESVKHCVDFPPLSWGDFLEPELKDGFVHDCLDACVGPK